MAIPTSRTSEAASVFIDEKKCTGCGLCVEVCKDFGLTITNGKASVRQDPLFGCIGCGHCMAVCPKGAIMVSGRCISPDDLFALPPKKEVPSYQSLSALMMRRRSIREFSDREVKGGVIGRVLDAARNAPMGLPPSDVNVLVLDSREKVSRFSSDFCALLNGMKWFVSGWFQALMRPFWGRETAQLFRDFVRPMIYAFTSEAEKGKDIVLYNAPVALYFYGTPFSDPADPQIAATYAMLAAESLGLGTCMIGSLHPMIQYGGSARKFREKYGVRYTSREGLVLIMGYPRVKYRKGVARSFANVDFI